MSTSENESKTAEPVDGNQCCAYCGGIRDVSADRVSESWVLRQGRCPDCFVDYLNLTIRMALGKLDDGTHQLVVSEILYHCRDGNEEAIKKRLDLLATELDEDLVGRDGPCIQCKIEIGYMDELCYKCWQKHQDTRNGVLEESDENRKESSETQTGEQARQENPCIDCGQNLNYMEGRCPNCYEEYQDAL